MSRHRASKSQTSAFKIPVQTIVDLLVILDVLKEQRKVLYTAKDRCRHITSA